MTASHNPGEVVVIGAGPAGLTAARELVRHDVPTTVLEADDVVGGISRTVERDGWRFDIGGHRFFTKVARVRRFWDEVLPDGEFLLRPRRSRILYRGRFYDYPLRPLGALRNLGPVEAARCAASYGRARISPPADQSHLAGWVAARFGERLYRHFFQSYNEKVWGVPASEIRAEWAAQRIKGLSFFSAAKSAFFGNKGNKVKSLISEFNSPRFGPGQMWDAMTAAIEEEGGEVLLEAPVDRVEVVDGRVVEVSAGGVTYSLPDAVISSLPLRNIVEMVTPPPPAEVLEAARGLRYRDFLTVALVVDGEDLFPDNWIYIHEPSVQVGRIQNYRSWSPWMVPDPDKACVGLEYFCFAGDELWTMDDDALVELATRELEELGLAPRSKVERGFATRVPKAYPIYDADYASRVAVVRSWLDGIENLQQVGRNGLHRYNNSDHSMLTAMRAVDNIVTGAQHDIWEVNAESVYHETDTVDEHPYRNAPETPELAASSD